MDKGVKHPSLRQAALANQWNSVEPDTESLIQERNYQQELQMPIGYHDQNKYKLSQKENTGNLEQGNDQDEDETEDLHVYDSLEVESHSHAKRNLSLLQMEYLDTHIKERERTR